MMSQAQPIFRPPAVKSAIPHFPPLSTRMLCPKSANSNGIHVAKCTTICRGRVGQVDWGTHISIVASGVA